MTVYEPGGPCLTQTQHDQQVFRKQLQEKSNVSATPGNPSAASQASDTLQPQAVQPTQNTEKTTATSGRLLNVTV